jgi:HAD superfamily hydrolase (TIGR01509 family)
LALKAIIFDLGGTLITYKGPFEAWPDLETPGFAAAYNLLKAQGVPLPPHARFRDAGFELLPARWQQAADGIRNLKLVDLLAETLHACGVDGATPTQVAEAAEAYQSAIRAQAALLPDAWETLAQVASNGYKIGLVSNTMFTGQAHIDDLDRFELTPYFDAMLFSADVNMWKPNPDPFLHILAELEVEPDAAVFIGDDPAADVIGGVNAGMRAIHINSGRRHFVQASLPPHVKIDSLSELLPVLAEWSSENTS